jgi:hypothetical protein
MSKDILNAIINEIEEKIDSADINPKVGTSGEVFYL